MKKILDTAREYLRSHNKIKTACLITLELPSSTGSSAAYIYLTDYFRDVMYNGILYTSGKVKSIATHKQNRDLSIGSLSFTITGTAEDEVLKLVQNGVSFLDRSISIHQAVIDEDGNILPVDPDTNGPLLYFRGKITGGGIKDNIGTSGISTSVITWNCSNQFYDFDRVNGRFTDDADHRGLEIVAGQLVPSNGAKRPEYQEDYGFFHANKSISILAKYQVQEERYKLQSKKKLFGLSRSYSLKKYYETVTKEVDLDFNLAAKFLPVVYGVQKVPGIPVFADTELHNPNIVYVVYAFAEGEIDGFLDFYFGDVPMICVDPNDSKNRTCFGTKKTAGDTIQRIASGLPDSSPSIHGQEYKYNDGNGDIRVWTFHGKPDQTAADVLVNIAKEKGFYLQNMNENGPEYWDSRYKLLDTAYAIVRFTINENRTEIPEVSAELQGKKIKIYHSDGKVTADRTSLNGIWQTLDYLTSDRYGANITIDQFPLKQLIQEAAILDIIDESYQVSWQPYWRYVGWTDAIGEHRQIVQMNTILDTSESVFKNVQGLLESFGGAINNLSGQYRITVEKYSNTPLEINFMDTYGDLELSDTTGRNKFNSVQASILDPALSWKTNSITFFNSIFKEQDKGLDKKLQLSFANITNYYTARSFADRELKKSRYSRTLSFSLPYHFIGIEPNDPIAFTYDRYGWNKKYFLVDEVENSREGKINITLQEYGEDVFINSEQVDNSGNDIPDVSNNVLPPRDFIYTPTPGGTVGAIGKNGELSWLPSLTNNVVYYSIVHSGHAEPYIVQQLESNPNLRMIQEIIGEPAGLAVFEIRAVDINGRRSSPVTLSVELNSAKNLSVVSNFRVTNTASGDASEFVGPDVKLAWDRIPEEDIIDGIYYTLEIYDNLDRLLRSVRIEDQYVYDYLLIYNKADYALLNEDALGINRKLRFRIRAEGDNGEQSVDWASI
ncbi:baseplate hub protein [Escherichia phage TrudiGerster]|uniref:Baseplate hub protein n=1 Tax=Escherichia phage TrudiGerster TaxID=2851991 RepID=A0AAE7VZV9_9CAUD|nr:baseplate hub protein [Escherichia phage TrudiGerster]